MSARAAELEGALVDLARAVGELPENSRGTIQGEDLNRAFTRACGVLGASLNGERSIGARLAWLVERQTPEGAVWCTANYQWTNNASEAAWFVRKEDAELFSWNLSDNATATEHCFAQ